MPDDDRPKLTLIEGGNQPVDEEERVRQQLKGIEESIERLLEAFEHAAKQRDESRRFTQTSWRKPRKWRP